MSKNIKKGIVNGLTTTRVLGTIFLPIMFNTLSAPLFIIVIGAILFTDFLDGALARHWDVSTIFGSLLDMGADKIFGIAVLIALSTIYPIMTIPVILETLILVTNVKNTNYGDKGKSSQLGRIKTWVLGLSICTLFITGMSKELIESLNNTNINSILEPIINNIINFIKNIQNNKINIENIAKTAAITSESFVASDYIFKTIKNSKEKKVNDNRIKEILKNKEKLELLKKVLLNEKYFKATKDMNLIDKLDPSEEQKEEIKKLMKI